MPQAAEVIGTSRPSFLERIHRVFKQGIMCCCFFVLAGAGRASAQATGDYAEDLARVYGAHQEVLATKEACDESFQARRAATDRAYAAWKERHRSLLADLDRRVTTMIHQASTDQKDYARNVGKYEGEILERRLELKHALLALDKAELDRRCRGFPAFLRSPEADFKKKYAAELQTIGSRK